MASNRSDFKTKKVLVYGLGRSGKAAFRLLTSLGAEVVVYDDRADSLPQDFPGTPTAFFQTLPADLLQEVDLAVISPGVPPDAAALKTLRSTAVPVMGEIEFASQVSSIPMVAVTGTNGKSTTVTLIDSILRASGKRSFAVGNIGYPFSAAVLDHPDAEFFVVEVSSYQLASIQEFAPRVSIITNLASNHHIWHGSQDAYHQAKFRIYENVPGQGALVYPAGCDLSRRAAEGHRARSISFTWGNKEGDIHHDSESRLILHQPTGEVLIDLAKIGPGLAFDYHAVLWNLLAACAAGVGLKLGRSDFEEGLATFQPLAHRMEPVRRLSGVRWVNDSKSTNVESTRYAIENSHARLVLLLGGRDKGLDFTELASREEGHIKAIVALGECREKIRSQLRDRIPVHVAEDLAGAIGVARGLAEEGDTVLFSPACASFDMFRNFEHRGEVFKELVNQMKPEGTTQ